MAGAPVPTFDTMIRNTDPGSNAGIPGLSLFAGMTPGGLPVGLEIDGPVGSDTKLLGLGTFDRGDIGLGAAAEDLGLVIPERDQGRERRIAATMSEAFQRLTSKCLDRFAGNDAPRQ